MLKYLYQEGGHLSVEEIFCALLTNDSISFPSHYFQHFAHLREALGDGSLHARPDGCVEEQTDVTSFAALEPQADGFRNYQKRKPH
jgi:hypothetical protein